MQQIILKSRPNNKLYYVLLLKSVFTIVHIIRNTNDLSYISPVLGVSNKKTKIKDDKPFFIKFVLSYFVSHLCC